MISEVCDLQTGATPSRADHRNFGGDTPWLVSGDINKGEITECNGRITKEGLENSNCRIIPANSVLIALNGQGKTRATVAVLRIPAALNQSLVAMIPYSGERLLPEYIFWNLRGRYYAIRDITGQGQRRGLNMKLVGQLSLPIPPTAEQKRIVTKVNELMALCDRLEAQQQERETRHAALARASLDRFANAPTPANLQFLFHPSYAIRPADLRKSILTLAVQGKLVPQQHGEDTGEQLQSAKRAKIAAKGTTKGVWTSEIGNNRPFAIPDNWSWICIGDAIDMINGRAFKSSEWASSGVPIVRIQNLNSETATFNYYEGDFDLRHKVENGSFLISWSGTPGTSFGAFIWNRGDALLNQHIFKCEFYGSAFEGEYLALSINARLDEMISHAQGGVGLRHITKGKLESIGIPLPPLAEQRRIVAKVQQLMALVDALETQLSDSRATAANLLSALVSELTGTTHNGKSSVPSASTTGRRGRPRKSP